MNIKTGDEWGDWFFVITVIPICLLMDSFWGILVALIIGTVLNIYHEKIRGRGQHDQH